MVLVVIHSMGSAHVSDERERQRTNGKYVWRQCQLCSPIIRHMVAEFGGKK